MKPQLKWIHSPDCDLDIDAPPDVTNFGMLIQMMIGPEGNQQSEAFNAIYCSPSWLAEEAARHGLLFQNKYIVSNVYDLDRLSGEIASFCQEIELPDWERIVAQLKVIGTWEFEGYIPFKSDRSQSTSSGVPMLPWIEFLARTGYAARGLVYVVIGIFAVLAAFGRSETKDTEGALEAVLAQPFGAAAVWFVALGLAAFAIWRTVQALRDTDDHGSDAKGLAIRAGLLLGAASYAAVAVLAASLVMAIGGGESGGDPTGGWLAALSQAGVAWLAVYAISAVLFAVGAAHIVKGWRAGFEKHFRCAEDVMRWLRPLSRFGLIARGIVFVILAGLIFRGGLAYDAESRPGLSDAMQAVQGYAFGWFLFLAIALGLIAFGLYSLAEARYRHVSAD